MRDDQNPENVGRLELFKYISIHGYDRWQTDKAGKSKDGAALWIKDYCRKESDPDYIQLTPTERYTLDGMRRLRGLHGKNPPNDALVISRMLAVAGAYRSALSHAVKALVRRGLLSLSNEPLSCTIDRLERVERAAGQTATAQPETEPEPLEDPRINEWVATGKL